MYPLSTSRFLYQSPRFATLPPLEGSDSLPRSQSLDLLTDTEPIADFDASAPKRKAGRADLILKQTPPLPPIDSPQFPSALSAKLSVCSAECFWEDQETDQSAKKIKTAALNEILELIRTGSGLTPSHMAQIVSAIEPLVFRSLNDVRAVLMRSDDNIALTEPAWPHLAFHYQILNALVGAFPDHPRFGTMSYIQSLIDRFRAPDANERSSLAYLLRAIQNSRPALRPQILKLALDSAIGYLDGQKSPNVVAPALIIAGQNFNDKPPTIEDHGDLNLYFQYILPLFGGWHYVGYQIPMAQIVEPIVKAVPSQTATATMKAILLRFPITRPLKAIEFLRLLTVVLTKVPPRDIKANLRPIFLLFARCAAMGQVKLTAAACPVWTRIELEPLLMDNAKVVFGLVCPILTSAQRDSWSIEISTKIDEVLRVLNRIDSTVYQDLCRGKMRLSNGSQQEKVKAWAGLARAASKVDVELNLATKLFEIQKQFASGQTKQSFQSVVSLPRPAAKIASEADIGRKISKPLIRGSG